MADIFTDCRKEGNENDTKHHQRKIVLDHWDVAEKIPRTVRRGDPRYTAQRAK